MKLTNWSQHISFFLLICWIAFANYSAKNSIMPIYFSIFLGITLAHYAGAIYFSKNSYNYLNKRGKLLTLFLGLLSLLLFSMFGTHWLPFAVGVHCSLTEAFSNPSKNDDYIYTAFRFFFYLFIFLGIYQGYGGAPNFNKDTNDFLIITSFILLISRTYTDFLTRHFLLDILFIILYILSRKISIPNAVLFGAITIYHIANVFLVFFLASFKRNIPFVKNKIIIYNLALNFIFILGCLFFVQNKILTVDQIFNEYYRFTALHVILSLTLSRNNFQFIKNVLKV